MPFSWKPNPRGTVKLEVVEDAERDQQNLDHFLGGGAARE
jgi:hypothetical protein